ncbi:MAG: hypothetical protein QUS14_07580, partial [Pyrinomonadaceae bacterium]|nr:hypothetical protein [Pyrinomonadaceae bacterium]
MKTVLCNALAEARASSAILLFGYAIMPDHIHIITDGKRTPSETLRYLNGVTARRVIDFLKTNGYERSLAKLQNCEKASNYKYSLWEHHSDKFIITSEEMFMRKLNYVHLNPVKAGFVEHPADYTYS